MNRTTVRPARGSDTDDIVELAGRAWRATYGDLLEEETIESALGEWYDPEGTRRAIESEEVAYFVATDGDLVGYLSGRGSEGIGHLGAIYVDPGRWGEGIGTRLLERFEQFCSESGWETIEFEVLADNDVGQSFYRGRGYSPVQTDEAELFGERVRETVFRGPVEG